jgi:hypothetical protein
MSLSLSLSPFLAVPPYPAGWNYYAEQGASSFSVNSVRCPGDTAEHDELIESFVSVGFIRVLMGSRDVLREARMITRLLWTIKGSVGSRVSSGSIVSDYGLDDRAIGVRSPAGVEDFSSSLCVQTGSGAHPASCTVGTGGPFPGGKKRGRGVTLTTHPHLVPRSRMSRSYTSSPLRASMACSGIALLKGSVPLSALKLVRVVSSLLAGWRDQLFDHSGVYALQEITALCAVTPVSMQRVRTNSFHPTSKKNQSGAESLKRSLRHFSQFVEL